MRPRYTYLALFLGFLDCSSMWYSEQSDIVRHWGRRVSSAITFQSLQGLMCLWGDNFHNIFNIAWWINISSYSEFINWLCRTRCEKRSAYMYIFLSQRNLREHHASRGWWKKTPNERLFQLSQSFSALWSRYVVLVVKGRVSMSHRMLRCLFCNINSHYM